MGGWRAVTARGHPAWMANEPKDGFADAALRVACTCWALVAPDGKRRLRFIALPPSYERFEGTIVPS